MFEIVFDGRLIFPPVTDVRRILDLGYGAASWAIDVSESYPDSTVRSSVLETRLMLMLELGHRR